MYRKILAVTFGTELSKKAVDHASRLAKAVGSQLLVLHVRSPLEVPDHAEGGVATRLGDEKIAEEIAEEERNFLVRAIRLAASHGVTAETAFTVDLNTYEAVVRVAKEQQCDLIVMATRIRHGIPSFLLKSTTQKVLEHTDIPVLVVR